MVSDLLFANIRAAKHADLLTDGIYNPLILSALTASGYNRSFEQIDGPCVTSTEPAPDWHSIEINLKTSGVCILAGSGLDLGGIAKGWTVSIIADELAVIGQCLVNIGGDMVGRGTPEGLPGWHVEIEVPFTGEAFATVYRHDQAISTSGIDYRRWQTVDGSQRHHIIDPRTGKPAVTDVLSAMVIHPSATNAEAYAKALILYGAEYGLASLNEHGRRCEALDDHT